MSGIALSSQVSRHAPRVKRPASRAFAIVLLSLAPNTIACQDLGALLVRQPAVTERWQQRLFTSPFGTVRAAMFNMQRPLGSAIPHSPTYILANFDPTNIAHWIGQQALSDGTTQFPEANRRAKTDLLTSRSREPIPPLFALAVTEPASTPAVLKTHDIASPLPSASDTCCIQHARAGANSFRSFLHPISGRLQSSF